MREIRNLYRFIPFGKFSLSGRGKPPFNQVFVGRQKERANFIELLTHQENFGAFLISGQRGAGKTSFVNYCLEEYERMAFQRSIRTSRNSVVYGFILLIAFCIAFTSGYVLLSQMLELGAQNVFEAILAIGIKTPVGVAGFASATVSWWIFPFMLGTFIMCFPAYFAMRTPYAISNLYDQKSKSLRRFWQSTVAMYLPVLLWLIFAYLDIEIRLESILFGILWSIVPLFGMTQILHGTAKTQGLPYETVESVSKTIIWMSFLMGLLGFLNLTRDENGADFSDLSLVALWFLVASHLLKSQRLRPSPARKSGFGLLSKRNALAFVTAGFLVIYFVAELEFGAGDPIAFRLDPQESIISLLQIAPALCVFCVLAVHVYRQSKTGPTPNGIPMGPVRTILLIKGGLFTLLSFVGILPALRVVSGWIHLAGNGSSEILLATLPELQNTHASYLTIGILIALIIVIYSCEYNWISRDLRAFRQDAAINLLGRSQQHHYMQRAWDPEVAKSDSSADYTPKAVHDIAEPRLPYLNDKRNAWAHPLDPAKPLNDPDAFEESRLSARRRFVFRQLENASLPHLIYSVRYPVLPVWINLGFDNLEHSRIIEAMLRRLRGLYSAKFLSLRSAVGMLNAFILMAIAVLFTSIVSKSVFHVGHIETIKRENSYKYVFETAEGGLRPKFGETNYCGFFEVYPEISPNVKSFICALPFNNAIMELLYSPVLQIHTDFTSNIATASAQFDLTRSNEKDNKETLAGAEALKACDPSWNPAKERPLMNFNWSNCLPRRTNSSDNTWVLDGYNEGMDRGQLYPHFIAGLSDVTANVTPLKGLQDATWGQFLRPITATRVPPQSYVAQSELVRFILDQNYGLPRIDFRTPDAADANLSLDYPDRTKIWYDAYSPYSDVAAPPTMRMYHIILYVLGFWMIFTINRRTSLLPYRRNLDDINELILLINGRETLRSGDREPQGWMAWLMPFRRPERVVETISDPRVVEQRLIELLNKLRPGQHSARAGFMNIFEIRPEITFIFDEMDKLSGIVDPELSKDAPSETQLEENNRERARSLQLHQLLSDMKRLISGNTARFIFIGGRLYHDEWLADQAQRAPILNSIFNGQIYLPSLMADRSHPYGRFNDRISELLVLMYRNARHRLKLWRSQRENSAFEFVQSTEEPTFVQFPLPLSGHSRRLAGLAHLIGMRVISADGKNYSVSVGRWHKDIEHTERSMSLGEQETLDQFINFLTYRSAGNPKKLKELIQGLVMPSSMALAVPRRDADVQAQVRWSALDEEGHDMITLSDNAIYRMQFIDMLYRHLSDHMESRMLDRDDKVSMSIFYLMDFLMKFHNRGFSRTNLQRVDELSHIHRAPDLRSVMGALVQVSSERFLHRVLNGVYNFRFRSDFAREIDYLSRISKEEMAALNFTLDESQSLKGLYQQTINTGERGNIDTVAGLGELYEYDQEYEIARNYYRRAITMLDKVQSETVQSLSVRKDHLVSQDRGYVELQMLGDILISDNEVHKQKLILSQIHWVVARIRLMMQVGQTYEQEMNFERANATFSHTTLLCDEVFTALSQSASDEDPFHANRTRNDLDINNFPILFQAGIAAAWVQEKDPENIDQSVIFAENWLQRIYEREPILQTTLPAPAEYPLMTTNSGGIFVQVALSHDRLGDLYFMKGRQSFKTTPLSEIVDYARYMLDLDQPEIADDDHVVKINEQSEASIITQDIATREGTPELVSTFGADGPSEDHPTLLPRDNTQPSRRAGYVDRAQYHYAAAVWMLRKFLTHRARMMRKSWHIQDTKGETIDALAESGVVPSHFHSTVADVLTDLSEAIYAKRSTLATAVAFLDETAAQVEASATADLSCIATETLSNFWDYRRNLLNDSVSEFMKGFVTHETDDVALSQWFGLAGDGEQSLIHDTGNQHTAHLLGKVTTSDHSKLYAALTAYQWPANPISRWIGTRNRNSIHPESGADALNPHFNKTMLNFSQPGDPLAQLEAYGFFSQSAARSSQRIGQSTNAANEYLLQAEATIAMLWEAKQVAYLADFELDGEELIGRFMPNTTPTNRPVLQSRVALAVFGSLKDAIDQIQFSDRPSISRMAQNHGNPDDPLTKGKDAPKNSLQVKLDEAIATRDALIDNAEYKAAKTRLDEAKAAYDEAKKNKQNLLPFAQAITDALYVIEHDQIERQLGEIEAKIERLQNKLRLAESETRTDYDLAQPLRDEPRPITQACSLIISLLNQKNDILTLSTALLVYKDILCKFASSTFDVNRLPEKQRRKNDAFAQALQAGKIDLSALKNNDARAQHLKDISDGLFEFTITGLKTTLERFRFPVLNRLQGLKVLADALLTTPMDNKTFYAKFGTHKPSEIGRLVREIIATAEIYGSEMHFPANAIGITAAFAYLEMYKRKLSVLYDDATAHPPADDSVNAYFNLPQAGDIRDPAAKPLLSDVIVTRESLGELAINKLNRSQETCAMGDGYYENIAYLYTMNDDFNDRYIHFTHARNLAATDFSEVLALVVKAGFRGQITYRSASGSSKSRSS